MKPDCQRKTGFTLIEMLVVIAIIGILAALFLPVLAKAKSNAHSATCKNHLRQMGVALQMYVHDHQDKYPQYLGPAGHSYGDATAQGGRAEGLVYWSSKLLPYYPMNWTNTSYHCPAYRGKIAGQYFPGAIDRLGSYAYNTFGVRVEGATNDFFGLGPVMYWKDALGNYVPPVSEAQISLPSEMLAIGDSKMKTTDDGGTDVWRFDSERGFHPELYLQRHGQNYNVLFCDGHVSAMPLWVLFNSSNTAPMWNYDHQAHLR